MSCTTASLEQSGHDQHLVSGGEQRLDLRHDEGLTLAEWQPLGDVHDLHGEALDGLVAAPRWSRREAAAERSTTM